MKKPVSHILFIIILLLVSCKKENKNTMPVIQEQSFTVAENTPAGSLVGQVVATDPENDPLIYNIVLGNAEIAFAIGETSGKLTVSNPDAIDFEKHQEFQLTVEVSDGVSKSQAMVVVNITDDKVELGKFNPRSFSRDGNSLLYQILFPYNYDEASALPLLVFLHGAGERGNDNKAQLQHGSQLFQDSIMVYPALVVFPQCPNNEIWFNSFDGPLDPAQPAMALVESLVDSLVNSDKVDPSRVYVAGLSMGGFGTAQMLAKFPGPYAAGVVICGGAPLDYADDLKKTPTWIFHGLDDNVVPPQNSIDYFAAIDEGNGKHRLTLYEGVDHFSWEPAFVEPDFLSWIFSKSIE
jgi:poly(3-hydroxybutyrate) depolymerase